MKRNADRLLGALVVVFAVALVAVVYGTLEEHITVPGDTAPDFRVLTSAGRTMTPKDFGGKLLVLNFWATWCPPCIEETPSLNAFAKQVAGRGIVVLGISVDRNEKSYKNFLQEHRLTFDTFFDPEANVSSSYGTFQFPETYIIDRSGKVIEKIISNQNFLDPEFIDHLSKMI